MTTTGVSVFSPQSSCDTIHTMQSGGFLLGVKYSVKWGTVHILWSQIGVMAFLPDNPLSSLKASC